MTQASTGTSTGTAAAARERAAEQELRGCGYADASVSTRGADGDIATVSLPRADFARVTAEAEALHLTERLRALGYRYVALDLTPREGGVDRQGTDR